MASPQYALAAAGSGSASATAFYLTGLAGASAGVSGSTTTITSYSKLAATPGFDPTSKALYTSADSGGSAVIAFYVFSIIALLLHTVSTIMFACNIRAKSQTPPCPVKFTTALFGLSFAIVGFVCYVIAAAITWGIFGALVAKYVSGSSISIITAPGAGLAGTGLVFVIIALSCELGSKLCCKDWKPPSTPVFNQPTTVIVSSGGLGYGAPVIHQQQQQQGGYVTGNPIQYPMAAEAKAAPPLITQQPQTQWRVQTNGTETCEYLPSPLTRYCLSSLPLLTLPPPFTLLPYACVLRLSLALQGI